jgi:hypothetical protein
MKSKIVLAVFLGLVFIGLFSVLNMNVVMADDTGGHGHTGSIGVTSTEANNYNLSWGKASTGLNEVVALMPGITPYGCVIDSIWVRCCYVYSPQTITCAVYNNMGLKTFIYKTEEKNISSAVMKWYEFNFTTCKPYFGTGLTFYYGAFGNAPGTAPSLNRCWLRVAGNNASALNRWRRSVTTYPTFTGDMFLFANDAGKSFNMYCQYSMNLPLNSTAITTYERLVNTKGTHQTAYSSGTGWKVWANYTTTPMLRENLVRNSGTHQYRWNSTTGYLMAWANYTGANLISRETLNTYLSGTHQSRYNSTTNNWMSWANYSGADLLSRETIVNASGVHDSRYNASTNHWMSWANYTGALTPLHDFANIGYASGTHVKKQNSTGWWIWANYTSALGDSSNIVGATGTHEHRWNSSANTWWDWANYTGNAPTVNMYQNIGNATGTHQSSVVGAVVSVWANYTSHLGNSQNIVNASGVHQSRWNATSGYWWDWANYTGSLTPIHSFDNIVNASGSHTIIQNSTGYWDWANYTGDTTPVTLYQNPLYASGTHTKTLRGVGGWDVYANYTSALGTSENIVDASGTHENRWNSSTNTWWAWANYTGTPTPLNIFENIGNAFGTHDNLLNSTGYWVWANYTSSQLSRENVVNASGTHDSRWNASTGTWMSWANYTGSLTPLHKFENILFASGTHTSKQNSTGYWVWANYTGDPSSLSKHESIVNATGTHDDAYDALTNTYDVWANYTGNLTALHLDEHIVNATGTHDYLQNSTGWWAWANYTGNLTPINSFENIVNATGTHTIIQNGTGYWDWANYTGDTTPVTLYQNPLYASGTHTKTLRGVGGWDVYANYTSALGTSENIVDASGTHENRWNSSTNTWWAWANYTGTPTPLNIFENIGNAFGTHDNLLNSTGYWVWANYTSSQLSRENVVNASGTHDSRWNASTGTWMSWANYTGSLTPLHKFENILFASGTHTSKQNSTGYWVWANYTGDPSSLSKHESIVNATGTHDDAYDALTNTYDVWANYTGNLTALHLDEHIVNATGTHDYLQNSTGWWAWANYTGNLTPINSFENIVNATGTHTIIQNGTGYWDWANYTGNASAGNSSALTLFENIINATGTHASQYNSSTGWKVWANYSSNLKSRENLNSYLSGTHQYRWNASTGIWMSWANYTGADLVTSENIVDATGSHDSRYNATTNKWIAWANYTGTASGGVSANLTIINPNPGNSTHQAEATGFGVGGNYQQNDSSGLTTSVDVSCINFTTPASVLPGSYNITINSTAFSNTPSTWNTSTVYSSVWGNSTGGIAPGGNLYVGQMEDSGDYSIFRSYLRFNTSSLPDDAVINSAYVKLVVWGDYSDTDFNVTLQSVKSPKPHNPLIPSDYSKAGIAGHHGHENTTGYVNDEIFNITLNSFLDINLTGMTRWSVRSNKDINATTPGADTNEFIIFYGNVLPVTNYPKLIINYTVPSSSWAHIVNLTFYNVSSGLSYATVHATGNGTVTVPATVFNGIGTYQWNVSYDNNGSSHGDTQVFTFVTVNVSGAVVNLTSYIPFGGGVVYKIPLLVGMTVGLPALLFTRRRRRRK